ncbi:hypothetical protein J1N35_034101 [Gossypium stocksii]|uniref:Uncharacterized protein n=1 Tax=Gossypium stocksii TaxID=47602 RepID=A0A9D3URP9_9ROSI|nr:hypothetical protein J1N35_034101 [Gossypium stocksii]
MLLEKGFTLKESTYTNLMRIFDTTRKGEIRNYAARHSGPTCFPFTITILCLKAKIFPNVTKTGYSEGTITDWDFYRVAGDSVLQQLVELSNNPHEEEEDPTKIEPMQSAEIPSKEKPIEPITELDMAASTFRTHSPHPDLRDELSKLMDLMQHI